MSKILRVNLNDNNIALEDCPSDLELEFLGGAGVSAKIFTQEVPANTKPFDDNNLLIFSVGPFCGTAVPFCGRHFVMAKSPLTNILGEASSGGFFGKELKSAGIDIVIIKGKSEKPACLWIHDGEAEILDASGIWGKGTQETHADVKTLVGDDKVKIAAIGPAGENLVRYACIINDNHHAAGRCGLGAIMGSKKLKAIAVRGTGQVIAKEKEKVSEEAKNIRELIKQDGLAMVMKDSGTPVHLDSMLSVGDMPMKNWTMGRWMGVKKLGAKALLERGEVKMHGCFNCPTACRGYVEYNGEWVSRPEYETLGMLGANLLVDDLETLIKWNLLVNDLGLDSISLGSVLGSFLEALDRNLLDLDFTQFGFEADQIWGNTNAIEKIIEMIARREGIGNDLAEGIRAFCEMKGLPDELALHGKGLEVPAHEPRANNLTALDYATTPRGAYHCYEPMHLSSNMNLKKELGLTTKIDRFGAGEEAADAVKKIQDASEAYSASGGCIMGFWFTNEITPWVNAFNAITGRSHDVDSWVEAGERIFNLKRKYNMECGITKADDSYGTRFSVPLPKGGTRKNVPPIGDLLQNYYKLRGWDTEGRP